MSTEAPRKPAQAEPQKPKSKQDTLPEGKVAAKAPRKPAQAELPDLASKEHKNSAEQPLGKAETSNGTAVALDEAELPVPQFRSSWLSTLVPLILFAIGGFGLVWYWAARNNSLAQPQGAAPKNMESATLVMVTADAGTDAQQEARSEGAKEDTVDASADASADTSDGKASEEEKKTPPKPRLRRRWRPRKKSNASPITNPGF